MNKLVEDEMRRIKLEQEKKRQCYETMQEQYKLKN